jgi:hypothetical protein
VAADSSDRHEKEVVIVMGDPGVFRGYPLI